MRKNAVVPQPGKNEISGTYFKLREVDAWDPIVSSFSVKSHPDKVLRDLGLIGQTGRRRFDMSDCYFDAKSKKWRYVDTGVPIAAEKVEGFKTRKDFVPKGVIRIIGDLPPKSAPKQLERAKSKRLVSGLAGFSQQRSVRQQATLKGKSPKQVPRKGGGSPRRLAATSNGSQTVTQKSTTDPFSNIKKAMYQPNTRSTPPPEPRTEEDEEVEREFHDMLAGEEEEEVDLNDLVDAADEDAEFISDIELQKYFRQYFMRALPIAANEMGAMIVTCGHGQVSRYIGIGLQNIREVSGDVVTPNDGTTTSGAVGLCVNEDLTQNENDAIPDVHPKHYSHYLFLKVNEQEKMSQVSPANHLPEFSGNAFLPNGESPISDKKPMMMTLTLSRHGTFTLPGASSRKTMTFQPAQPKMSALHTYVGQLVNWLHKGYSNTDKFAPKDDSHMPPPDREKVPVVSILVGGGPDAKHHLKSSVENRWPILVMEGTGGLADKLANVIKKVEHQTSDDTEVEDYRKYTAKMDPATADILNYGKLRLMHKGKNAEALQRFIEHALKGDEVLEIAWSYYAKWTLNQNVLAAAYKSLQRLMLGLQLLTTTLAIVMTFALLVEGTSIPPTEPASPIREWAVPWTLMQASVIALPIIITLLQAVQNQLNPGTKYVQLMTTSVSLLSEIYMYRSAVRGYSPEEVRKAQQDETYFSKEELLHQRMDELAKELIQSAVAEVTLKEYQGSLPPPNILKRGDDGFSELTPEAYVRVRLEPAIAQYGLWSTSFGKQKGFFTYWIYIFGALGTGFGALAAYVHGSFQAWVALTTACQNAAQRYLDYSRLEWLQKKSNKTQKLLSDVQSVWMGRQASDDSLQARNDLVGTAEDVMLGEVHAKAQQLGDAMEKAKKDTEAETEKLKNMKDVQSYTMALAAESQKMIDLELEDFTLENVVDAIKDPKGAAADSLRASVVKLNHDLGNVMKPAAELLQKTDLGKKAVAGVNQVTNKAQQLYDEHGKLITTTVQQIQQGNYIGAATGAVSHVGEMVGIDMRFMDGFKVFINDSKERGKLLSALKGSMDVKKIGFNSILSMAKAAKSPIVDKMQSLTQRQVLEVMKSTLIHEVIDQFFSDIVGLDKSVFITSDAKAEDFISEFKSLALVDGVHEMSFSSQLNLVRDKDIKKILMGLGYASTTRLIWRAEQLFDMERGGNIILNAMELSAHAIADLEAESLMNDKTQSVKIWSTIGKVQALGNPPGKYLDMMPKADLLELLPPSFKSKLQHSSQFQLASYLKTLSFGTGASRVWTSFKQRSGELYADFFDKIGAGTETMERFVLSNQAVTQLDVNKLTKGALLSKLRVSSVFNDQVDAVLDELPEQQLKEILSSLQATISNSYSGRIMDALADAVGSFDVNTVVGVADRDMLVSKTREFDGMDITTVSKDHILASVAFERLRQTLQPLEEEQLHELFMKLDYIMAHTFQMRTFQLLRTALKANTNFTSRYGNEMAFWDEEFVDHLVNNVDEDLIATIEQSDSTTAVLDDLGDVQMTQKLQDFDLPDLRILINGIYQLAGERVLSNVFETAFLHLQDDKVSQLYEEIFSLPKYREEFTEALQGISTYSLEDIRNLPIKTLKSTMALSSELSLMMNKFSPSDYKRVVFVVLSELTTSLAYRLFVKTANHIRKFDLRDLISDLKMRFTLMFWVYDIVYHRDLWGSAFQIEEVFGKNGRQYTLGIHKPMKDILRCADELMYYDITMVMRLLNEEQFHLLLTKTFEWFLNYPAGRFFHHHEKNRHTDSEDDIIFQRSLESAISFLKFKVKMSPQEVYKVFLQFDAKAFVNIPRPDKQKILSAYVDNDDLVLELVGYTEPKMRDFFDHIHTSAVNFQSKHNQIKLNNRQMYNAVATVAVTSAFTAGKPIAADCPTHNEEEEEDDTPFMGIAPSPVDTTSAAIVNPFTTSKPSLHHQSQPQPQEIPSPTNNNTTNNHNAPLVTQTQPPDDDVGAPEFSDEEEEGALYSDDEN